MGLYHDLANSCAASRLHGEAESLTDKAAESVLIRRQRRRQRTVRDHTDLARTSLT